MPGERPTFLDRYMPSPSPAAGGDGAEHEGMPEPGTEYKPFGRRSATDEFASHFILPGGGTARSLQYQHLDEGHYSPECMVLTFMVIKPKKVTILGRGFRQQDYDQIHQRRTPWVREAVRDSAADGDTIVLKVMIEVIDEEKNEGDGRPGMAVESHDARSLVDADG